MIFYREEFSLSSVETQVHAIDEEIVTSKDEAILNYRYENNGEYGRRDENNEDGDCSGHSTPTH